jgi:hypothetical protein
MLPELVGRQSDGSDVVVPPPLSQAVGYIIVVVIGLVIAFGKSLSPIFALNQTLTLNSDGWGYEALEAYRWRGQPEDRDVYDR